MRIACQHGSLVNNTYALQIFFNIKSFTKTLCKFCIKICCIFFSCNIFTQLYCFCHIIYNYSGRYFCCMRKSSTGFFMRWFTMHYYCIIFFGNLISTVPNFFNKWAGSIVFFCRNSNSIYFFFN